MAVARRTRAAAFAAALLAGLGACSWGGQEPGLFSTPSPSDVRTTGPDPTTPPDPTNPRLPVLAEALWTSADGGDVTVRFAVHAVRRTPGATVLDWSVTPLPGTGRQAGAPLPSGTDLGLERALPGQQDLALLDTRAGRAYRPLANVSPRLFSRCLCTPLFAVLPGLRFGETRVLQLAFPSLPASTSRVDVALPNLPVVPGVPVTALGEVPVATAPTDLARPAVTGNAVTGAKLYLLPGTSGDLQTVVVNRVVASPGLTSVVWRLYSVDDQDTRTRAVAPLSRPRPAGVRLVTEIPASGPALRVPGRGTTGVRWTTATAAGQPAYECLCSGLGLWSRGLREGGGSAQLVTQVGPLPRGTERVDVAFPGLDDFTDVRVTWVDDTRALPTEAVPRTTWTYDATDPPRGWSTADWPTPVPDAAEVADYTGRPERILAALP